MADQRGPRGGRTTVSAGGYIRKSILLSPEANEALRSKAFAERRSEAEIVREALSRALGLVREPTEG
jgi:hypothetical protein